jgi:hypothetical protein
MLKLTVNDVSVFILHRDEFTKAEYTPKNVPSDYMKLDPYINDEQAQIWFKISDAFDPNGNWLKVAGHLKTGSIDYAVPQDWWNEQYKKLGKAPAAFWTYEKGGYAGEPLWWDTVVREARENVKKAFDEWLAPKLADKKEENA